MWSCHLWQYAVFATKIQESAALSFVPMESRRTKRKLELESSTLRPASPTSSSSSSSMTSTSSSPSSPSLSKSSALSSSTFGLTGLRNKPQSSRKLWIYFTKKKCSSKTGNYPYVFLKKCASKSKTCKIQETETGWSVGDRDGQGHLISDHLAEVSFSWAAGSEEEDGDDKYNHHHYDHRHLPSYKQSPGKSLARGRRRRMRGERRQRRHREKKVKEKQVSSFVKLFFEILSTQCWQILSTQCWQILST